MYSICATLSTARPRGALRVAAVAGPPSPEYPPSVKQLPTSVVMMDEVRLTRRTQLLSGFAKYKTLFESMTMPETLLMVALIPGPLSPE